MDTKTFEPFIGQYQLENGDLRKIAIENSQLTYQRNDGAVTNLNALTDGDFTLQIV